MPARLMQCHFRERLDVTLDIPVLRLQYRGPLIELQGTENVTAVTRFVERTL